MANKGYVQSLLNRIKDADTKQSVTEAFEYVLDNLRVGGVGDLERAENFQWYVFDTTTSSVANQEFSIEHGLNQAPNRCTQWLDLTSSGNQVVRLRTPRPADARRIYLSSPDTGAPIQVLAEV